MRAYFHDWQEDQFLAPSLERTLTVGISLAVRTAWCREDALADADLQSILTADRGAARTSLPGRESPFPASHP